MNRKPSVAPIPIIKKLRRSDARNIIESLLKRSGMQNVVHMFTAHCMLHTVCSILYVVCPVTGIINLKDLLTEHE